jgi:hypothetical protein
MEIENDDDFEVAAVLVCDQTIFRSSSLHRTRWNSFKLRRLAVKEGSFVAEYRVSPREFDVLHQLLQHELTPNVAMANLSTSRSGSAPITSDSRLCKIFGSFYE